jgi:hypothetical protein
VLIPDLYVTVKESFQEEKKEGEEEKKWEEEPRKLRRCYAKYSWWAQAGFVRRS